ncbi:MAG: alginate O-acetyltransferase complex protein AlgI [Verrucomicrobiales bacterium]|jgi:alginate O-acetyltransferase complex protein AlgI
MLFPSTTFLLFFATLLLLFRASRAQLWRKAVLLGASYFFYAWWDFRFLALIGFVTLVDYAIGGFISRSTSKVRRRQLLTLSLVVNLGVLGIFKYLGFFVESANHLLSPLGIHLGTLEIILPVGISFFTFQSMSYIIDIYRRSLKPCASLLDFALFVSFFPQLVAGPIVRAAEFLPQLKKPIRVLWENAERGTMLFLMGVVKKVLIADHLAIFVDQVYAAPHAFDSLTLWLAGFSYMLQILCDFSGYSDMAIGIALWFGFRLPVNFRVPYLATSIADFWRRWHISLSSWLRDYLYVSLGGNRRGDVRTYVNLMLTMLLGGIWHGASWSFLVWGGVHGCALAIHRLYQSRIGLWPSGRLGAILGWALTFSIVFLCWIPFRITDFNVAAMTVMRMFTFDGAGISWFYAPTLLILTLAIGAHLFALRFPDWTPAFSLRTFRGQFLVALTVMGILLLSPLNSSPFIYFQF